MSEPPDLSDELTIEMGKILDFARCQLGSASEKALREPAVQAMVLYRLRRGAKLEDAVLAGMHKVALQNNEVADEFLSYFLVDLYRQAQRSLRPWLKRYLDTGDLVHSVLGDMWPDWNEVQFESEGRFRHYLANRLQWKASDKSRRLRASMRREDRRQSGPPEDYQTAAGHSPPSLIVNQEELEQMALILARLRPKEQALLRRQMKGESLQSISEALNMSPEATRKALQRGVLRAQKMAKETFGEGAAS
ncbi:MAG: sigma-70 family RNA polymerase sigma factor [Planctomycetota bacterium]|nr:MAG: sigma-70 family RNA polymerase sigma factor [Planctomycetota bacterium]